MEGMHCDILSQFSLSCFFFLSYAETMAIVGVVLNLSTGVGF